MYVIKKQGCDNGKTRPININNSIRQGGVLAVTQYATLIDEINKEINSPGQTYNPNEH